MMSIERMNIAMAKATDLLHKQEKIISNYDKLSKAQDWAIKALGETLNSVCNSCADVAKITDDPEVQNKMWEIVQEVEKLQAKAQEALAMVEDI